VHLVQASLNFLIGLVFYCQTILPWNGTVQERWAVVIAIWAFFSRNALLQFVRSGNFFQVAAGLEERKRSGLNVASIKLARGYAAT